SLPRSDNMTILLGSIGAVLLLAALAIQRYRFWRNEAVKMTQGAYLPPAPGRLATFTLKLVGRLAAFLFIGKIKVIGRQNARYKGKLLIVGNHQFMLDVATMSQSIPGAYRHLGKAAELKHPLRSFFAVWTGHFAAVVEAGKAQGGSEKVIEACAQALSGSNLLLFPQGKLVYDNVLRPDDFRTGAVRAAQLCRSQYDQDVAFLPVGIHYHEEKSRRSWLYGLMNAIGFRQFRRFPDSVKTRTFYGASVVIGKPIPLASLPENPREATEMLRQSIQDQLSQAQNLD
ncbi:MAG: 1-acyl-sn-glycerol-3-phosphate acyltransferase, partial [Candidatus Obscuribacterales bacterium]|nr:1-acyl-sn-glycerol-3-phosphate acyltransferase [Candidatus Obscuribacterales bacterium]